MAPHSSILAWKVYGQRSLAGYSPWGHKETQLSDWACTVALPSAASLSVAHLLHTSLLHTHLLQACQSHTCYTLVCCTHVCCKPVRHLFVTHLSAHTCHTPVYCTPVCCKPICLSVILPGDFSLMLILSWSSGVEFAQFLSGVILFYLPLWWCSYRFAVSYFLLAP